MVVLLWWRCAGMVSEEEVGAFLPACVLRRYLGLSVWNSLHETNVRRVRAGRGVFSGRATVETWDWRRNGAGVRICATERLCANERLMAAEDRARRSVRLVFRHDGDSFRTGKFLEEQGGARKRFKNYFDQNPALQASCSPGVRGAQLNPG